MSIPLFVDRDTCHLLSTWALKPFPRWPVEVLVAWDHCSIPALAQAFGCDEDICIDCGEAKKKTHVAFLQNIRQGNY